MFREFFQPHIADFTDAMEYPMYHLDGKGAIAHLDALLEIKNLKAIQWEPGAGNREVTQWYDLIKKILAAGKSVQVFAEPEEIDDLVKTVGTKGLLITLRDIDNKTARKITGKYID